MKKMLKLLITVLIISIIIIIFIFSIKYLNIPEPKNIITSEYTENTTINKYNLTTTFFTGKNIDTNITYGNISSHEIKIKNDNEEKVSFAIYLKDYKISNDLVTYDIFYKLDESSSYEIINKNNKLKDTILLYNITIDAKQVLFIKIDFKSNKENDNTNIKGILSIDNNVSETELFNQSIYKIQTAIDSKISSLNGISESGYYLLNIKDYIDNDTKDYKGLVFINAQDISNLKFYYSIYNTKYMLDDYLYTKETIKKSDIKEIDNKVILTFNDKDICKNHTNKKCLSFNDLKYNSKGDKKAFTNEVLNIINGIKEKHKYTDNKVYIYDIKEELEIESNMRGFILIDNSNSKNEYYLYLTNNLYMVSGYNITKYGMFKENSSTIRAYNDISFNLSSESKKTVCKFTGFTLCYGSNNKKI